MTRERLEREREVERDLSRTRLSRIIGTRGGEARVWVIEARTLVGTIMTRSAGADTIEITTLGSTTRGTLSGRW